MCGFVSAGIQVPGGSPPRLAAHLRAAAAHKDLKGDSPQRHEGGSGAERGGRTEGSGYGAE